MNQNAQKWVDKAEGDFECMNTLAVVFSEPLFDSICFHAEQCVEKYLKALLCENEVEIVKTHDLELLLSYLENSNQNLAALKKPLARLIGYAVAYRYPGYEATESQAKNAIELRVFCAQRFVRN